MKTRALSAMAFSLLALPAAADEISPNCNRPEFRRLDFWVGDWDLTWQGNTGTNHIKKSLESCVIEENFDGRPGQHLMGHSVSMYDARAANWKQTWVDNEGGYIALRGGPQKTARLFSRQNRARKAAARAWYSRTSNRTASSGAGKVRWTAGRGPING